MKKTLVLGLLFSNSIYACLIIDKKRIMVDQLTVQFARTTDNKIWHLRTSCKPDLAKYASCSIGELRSSGNKCSACHEEITFCGYSRINLLKMSKSEIQFFLDQAIYRIDSVTGDILK